jgi:hypothetical protein
VHRSSAPSSSSIRESKDVVRSRGWETAGIKSFPRYLPQRE